MAVKQNSLASSAAIHSPRTAFKHHWLLYVDEGVELAIFMISACFFTVWLFDPASPALKFLPNSALRRLLMGMSMGATAILIIRSPMGKRSGAHFNPAITLTYFRLGKIDKWDAGFYVVSQFIGGICGVGLSALCLGSSLAVPTVDYAVTVPGYGGTTGAFCAEYFMAALLMLVVLWFSNRPPLAQLHELSCRSSDYVLRICLRASFRLQHQPRTNHRLGRFRQRVDCGMALLSCASARHDDIGGGLSARLRHRECPVRQAASGSQLSMPFHLSLPAAPPCS